MRNRTLNALRLSTITLLAGLNGCGPDADPRVSDELIRRMEENVTPADLLNQINGLALNIAGRSCLTTVGGDPARLRVL